MQDAAGGGVEISSGASSQSGSGARLGGIAGRRAPVEDLEQPEPHLGTAASESAMTRSTPDELTVLSRVARGEAPASLLNAIALLAEGGARALACCICVTDRETKTPRLGAAPSVPADLAAQFANGCCSLDRPPSARADGGEPAIRIGLETQAEWSERHSSFVSHGYRAGWSTTILSPNDTELGVLTVYAREARGPNPDELVRLRAAADIASLVLARAEAERRLEALETHAREAEQLLALGRVAGNIAHDFNNTLTAITGQTHLALMDLDEGRPVRESLLAIREAGTRAAEVVKSIATFSRGKSAAPSSTRLDVLLSELRPLLRSALPRSIALDLCVSGPAPAVAVDSIQLQQALLGVCTLARDLMKGAGRLALELGHASPTEVCGLGATARQSERYARLCVKDSGPALDAAALRRISEPLSELGATGRRTGFELAAAEAIVRAHEGALRVRSASGVGNEFIIYLPELTESSRTRAPSPASAVETPAHEAVGQARPREPSRIMYVDDEEALVTLVVRWLTRRGYQVTGFSNPLDALEAFRAAPQAFDVLISDFTMPGLSGLDLVREVMSLRPDLVVVMSSGFIRPEDRQRARELGAIDVVLKPQGMAEFGRLLQLTLGQCGPHHEVTRHEQ